MSRSELIQLYRSYGIATNCSRLLGMSGEIAAGSVSAFDVLAAFNYATGAGGRRWIERIHIKITTITAFTVPLTPGRALMLCGISQMPDPGGANCYGVAKSTGQAGDTGSMAIADTAPLTGVTALNGKPIAIIPIVELGAAGSVLEYELNFGLVAANMAFSGFLALAALSTFDAGGTIQIEIDIDTETEGVSGF